MIRLSENWFDKCSSEITSICFEYLKLVNMCLLLAFFLFRHAQVLAALQPFTHWMAQLYSEIQEKGNSQAHLSSLLSSCLDSIVPVLINKVILVFYNKLLTKF